MPYKLLFYVILYTPLETVMEALKPDCSGLPQSCPEPPQSENREIKCSCPTVNCTWSQWSEWSATCGPAIRQKTVTTQQVRLNRFSVWENLPKILLSPSLLLFIFYSKVAAIFKSQWYAKHVKLKYLA